MSDVIKKFDDSTMSQNFVTRGQELAGGLLQVQEEWASMLIKSALMSMSDYARVVKKKEKPIAVVVDDLKGNILLGIKVQFLEGTEDNPEGSWNPVWSFDPEDFADCDIYKVSESKAFEFFINRAKVFGMQYTNPSNAYTSAVAMADTMVKWLDENANEKSTEGVELPGIFKITVSVIDGKKVMTFSADEELTNLVKDDAKLQAVE